LWGKEFLLFLKIKKRKDFAPWGVPRGSGMPQGAKVFWFFFSKKNSSSLP